jgi:SSS family solute:Na+ symporter
MAKEMIDPVTGEVIRGNAQAAFPLLVQNILPAGFRGMVVAGLLAALMSSLAGVLNATATLFTMDFYSRIHKSVSQEKLVWIGRVATGVLVVIGFMWIPVIQGAKGLYDYLQGIQAYLAPPIFVVFFFGIFDKRLNGKGCVAALIVGFLLGLFRLMVDTPVAMMGHTYTEGSLFWIMNNMFFQYYSILILIVCTVIFYAVSYLTEAPDYGKISGLTYGTVSDADRESTRSSWDWKDIFWSGFVIVCILAAYLYFTG